jgi:MFS family permease
MNRWQKWVDRYGLTAGELGAAASQTLMVALLPVLLRPYAPSTFWIGFAVGGEGFFALTVPFLVGWQSDHLAAGLARRFGRRTLFLAIAAPVMAAVLVLVPFLHGYVPLTVAAFVFFAALQGYLTPLWALMIDAVPRQSRSRVQGMRGLLRSAGLAFGLVGGGLLQALWRPLPFFVVALLLLATTGITFAAGRKTPPDESWRAPRRSPWHLWHELRQNGPAGWFMLANALWSGAVDGIRPYFFLFAFSVLGIGVGATSAGLLLLVAGLGLGSFTIGHLGATQDRNRLLQAGMLLTLSAFVGGFFARQAVSALLIVPLAGVGSAAMVALAYPVFAELVGSRNIGQYTGAFVFTVGFGRIIAPMLVGLSVDYGARLLPAEHGYPFMWLTAAAFQLAGLLASLRSHQLMRRGRQLATPPTAHEHVAP